VTGVTGMTHTLRLDPTVSLRVSSDVCSAATLLKMTNEDLSDHTRKAARANPFLQVSAPSESIVISKSEGESLYAFVMRQIHLAFQGEPEIRIAVALAEALEPTGWLGREVAEIAVDAGSQPAQVATVLKRCQQFEPTGLFARNLAECLRLQLAENDVLTSDHIAVLENLDTILEGGIDALAETTGLGLSDIDRVMQDLRACDPKPGAAFERGDMALARQPDILVRQNAGKWSIELNRSTLPTVSLTGAPCADDPVLEQMREDARALASAVDRRNRMTLKVVRAVVSHQIGFLENGRRGLLPLKRLDVARDLGVHESTISRVVQGLLVQTPARVLELRRFFSRSLGTGSDMRESRRRMMDRLEQLIACEPPAQPLSDAVIAETLALNGARISRRTVAKYRKLLNVPAARSRCRSAKLIRFASGGGSSQKVLFVKGFEKRSGALPSFSAALVESG